MISQDSIACSKTSSRCPLRRKTHLGALSLPRRTRPTRNHGTTLSAGSSRLNRRANFTIHARRLRKRATDVCSEMEVIRTCAEIISRHIATASKCGPRSVERRAVAGLNKQIMP